MSFVSLNGKHYPFNEPLITADNRGFKYGDGFFETIKVQNGSIQLMKYHFDRIIRSSAILKIDTFHIDKQLLVNDILQLCKKNDCIQSSRVRIAFYRSENDKGEYLIEALPYVDNNKKKTFSIGLYSEVQKSIDILSNLKTANFLPYVMASMHAKHNSLDDCLIMNTKGSICDSSKANVFIIKNGEIHTPSLKEGCVDGTMRRFLIKNADRLNIQIIEDEVSFEDVLEADEVFLTNAIVGIQSVTNCRQCIYSDSITQELSKNIFQPFDQLIVD